MSKKSKSIEEFEIIYDKVISGKYNKEKFIRLIDAMLFKKWCNGYEQSLIDCENNKTIHLRNFIEDGVRDAINFKNNLISNNDFTDEQKEQIKNYK